MIELQIVKFEGNVNKVLKLVDESQKIVFMANGGAFEYDIDLIRIRNLLNDFMVQKSGSTVVNVDHAVKFIFCANAIDETTLSFNFYRYNKTKDEMERLDIYFEAKIDRKQLADNDVYKKSLEKPKKNKIKAKITKNIEKDSLGDTLGRIHVQQDTLKNLRLKKIKKRKKGEKAEAEAEEEEEG